MPLIPDKIVINEGKSKVRTGRYKKLKRLAFTIFILTLSACSGADIVLEQGSDSLAGDETNNDEINSLEDDENTSSDDVNVNDDDIIFDFEGLGSQITRSFKSCKSSSRVFDFQTEECLSNRNFISCDYESVKNGSFSSKINTSNFSSTISGDYLIQCYEKNGEKVAEAAKIINKGDSGLSIGRSCWIINQDSCSN